MKNIYKAGTIVISFFVVAGIFPLISFAAGTPTITLNGFFTNPSVVDPLTVDVCGYFSDPGVTGSRGVSTDSLSKPIVTGGVGNGSNINTTIVGTTTLTYTVDESDGVSTTSASVTRDWSVVPVMTPPTVTLNISSPLTLTVGDAVPDLSFTGVASTTQATTCDVVSTSVTGGPATTTAPATFNLVYTITDSTNGLSASTSLEVDVLAAPATPVAPTITLIGSNPIDLTVGDIFTDPGVTITTTPSTDTSTTSTTGTVDTSVVGTTTLIYTATDTTNSLSASTTRDVVVNAAPVTPSVAPTITSNSTSNPLVINIGDTFTDPGATATTTEVGDILSSIVETGGPVDTSSATTTILTYSVVDLTNGLGATTTLEVDVVTPPSTPSTPTTPTTPPSGGGGGNANFFSQSTITPTSTPEACDLLTDYMRIDLPNNPEQVTYLQELLNKFTDSNLAITGVFDQATLNAVNAFQIEYAAEVLTPWGAGGPSGYVYITTLKELNLLNCNLDQPLTSQDLAIIQAYKNAVAAQGNGGNVNGNTNTPSTNNGAGTTTTGTTTSTSTLPQIGVLPTGNTGVPQTANVFSAITGTVGAFLINLFHSIF